MRNVPLGLLVLAAGACTTSGQDDDDSGAPGASSSSSAAGTSSAAATSASAGISTSSSAAWVSSCSALAASSSSSSTALADPAQDGPESVTTQEATVEVPGTGTSVGVQVHVPAGGGARPLVLISHGMQLPISQYATYAHALASHGLIAILVDFNQGLFTPNHLKAAQEILGVLDWATAQTGFSVNAAQVGLVGHSLGGKLSFLAATLDPRVGAVLGLDPVDTVPAGCSAATCPDVSGLLGGLHIPTGVLGETTDATGGVMGQSCAPAADNFLTYYQGANSPSFAVTVNGANHMSFLDDVASCGLTCSLCNAATAANGTVNGLARAYTVAFFRRHLDGEAAMQDYLTGSMAQERYVTPGLITLQQK